MHQFSAPVTSRQTAPHPGLQATVLKHLRNQWRKPVADHSLKTFVGLEARIGAWSGSLILDTGCGTGMSTSVLAKAYPEALVLGIDKSAARLDRHAGPLEDNALLVRMDLEDFWLLAAKAQWRFDRQCFFYPNPWPKPEQRLRRWAFHPVLPTALICGGVWELRTNWAVYAQEFALAVGWATGTFPQVFPWSPAEPETLFERKYLASGHPLWRWEVKLGSGRGPQPSGPEG